MNAVATLMSDGKRLHLQHGPIDLIIGADGDRDRAFAAAKERFRTILDELVAELPLLRTNMEPGTVKPNSDVALRMHQAVHPFAAQSFVTPMAAVAGSVADEVLQAMCDNCHLDRAYVNNGGDIAIHLTPGTGFKMAMAGHDGADLGRIEITHADPVRGIATSSRHGRSLSLGIADSVTTLARTAADADVAATLIANHVDLPNHPAITRCPANQINDDSDLGSLPVVTACGPLPVRDVDRALETGLTYAQDTVQRGLIMGASLFLQKQNRTTQTRMLTPTQRTALHA